MILCRDFQIRFVSAGFESSIGLMIALFQDFRKRITLIKLRNVLSVTDFFLNGYDIKFLQIFL